MYQRRQRRKHEDTNDQRSAWPSSISGAPLLIPQPYDPHGSYRSQNPLLPLRPGQQYASAELYPQRDEEQPIIESSSTTSGSTAIASTPSHGSSSSVNRNGISNSDHSTSVQLRNEIENLRREVEEIRARSFYEPPPQYS